MNNIQNLKREFEKISKIQKYDNTENRLYLYTVNDKWFLSENNMKNDINIPDFVRPILLNLALDDFAKKLVKGMIAFGKDLPNNNYDSIFYPVHYNYSNIWSFNIKNTKFIFSVINTMQGNYNVYPPYIKHINILCNPLTIGNYNIADDLVEVFVELDYEDNFMNDFPAINVKYVNHKFQLFGEIKDNLEIIDRRFKENNGNDDIILYPEEETNESKITKSLNLEKIDL
jgi:hypothetical protein